jgi:hypothetical protein
MAPYRYHRAKLAHGESLFQTRLLDLKIASLQNPLKRPTNMTLVLQELMSGANN